MVTDSRKTHNSSSSRCEIVKHGVPKGSSLGPLFFFLYINDLHKIPTNKAKIIIYIDDTNVTAQNPRFQDFDININEVFVDINE
jgi:hypothetical protein